MRERGKRGQGIRNQSDILPIRVQSRERQYYAKHPTTAIGIKNRPITGNNHVNKRTTEIQFKLLHLETTANRQTAQTLKLKYRKC